MPKRKVRFAPSPTGNLHIGSARTALFNFLYSQKNKAEFVLRIEDTDKERSQKVYEDDIMRSLKWIGVNWDNEPYRQSGREEIYKKYVLKLLEEKKAYPCFCSKEKLEKQREEQQKQKKAPRYEGDCHLLSDQEKEKMMKEKDFVIRIRVKDDEAVEFQDKIKGKISFNSSDIGGDFVIAKKDFSCLYNFACVVDDYEMGITDIIRGDDHISNTPKQIIIGKALNLPIPEFAHLPLILGPDKSKLSKRHGASSLYSYKEQGYLPEALFNFISLLGWNPGTDQEVYPPEEIIEMFSIEKCHKSPAVFDIEKLKYINGLYIRGKEIEEVTKLCIPFLIKDGLIKEKGSDLYYAPETEQEVSFQDLEKIVEIYQERLKVLSEIGELVDYFFKKELKYEKELLFWKKRTEEETKESIDKSIEILLNIKKWEKGEIEERLLEESSKMSNRGDLLWPLRAALSGKKASASPFDILLLLGKEKSLERLNQALSKL
jgi:glutamyl-tRNA synthetase